MATKPDGTMMNFGGTDGQVMTSDGAGAAAMEAVAVAGSDNLLHIRQERAVNTANGSSSVGANTTPLNTVVTNEITGSSLSSNQITLPAGTYHIYATIFGYDGTTFLLKGYLYNITDSALEIAGSSERAIGSSQGKSTIIGRFTIGATEVFELRQSHSLANATNGLGVAADETLGGVEVYAEVQIREIN